MQQVQRDLPATWLIAGDFTLLHVCCLFHADSRWPSYIPPLKACGFICILANVPGLLPFRVGCNRPPNLDFDDQERLKINGSSVDSIKTTLDNVPQIETCVQFYEHVLKQMVTDPEYSQTWRVDPEINNHDPRFRRPPYQQITPFEAVSRTFILGGSPQYGNLLPETSVALTDQQRLKDRAFFWTELGYIGLGPRHVQPGDQVVILDTELCPTYPTRSATFRRLTCRSNEDCWRLTPVRLDVWRPRRCERCR